MTCENLDRWVEQLDFKGAKERLKNKTNPTRLIYSDAFSNIFGNEIYLKPENLQVTGAFKIRGAYNKISKMTEEQKTKGLISASAGNHAQGVAYSAKEAGASATIVMPSTTPLIKVEGTRKYGVDVLLYGTNFDEAFHKAEEIAKEKNLEFVHPFDDLDVIEGQGTISLEILKEQPDMDIIIVPIGGGGLISGIAVAAKQINPNIKIIGVEPEGAKSMTCSIEDGHITCLDNVDTIADGVAVKEPGKITYELVRNYVDEIISVSDYEIMESFIEIMETHKLMAESSGAMSVAAAKKLKVWNKKVACVISGGNIDMVTISTMVQKGLISKGRLFGFTVLLPDRPGELLNIARILAEMSANVVEVSHDQFKTADRLTDVVLQVQVEANGHDHINKIIERLYNEGYKVKRTS
ncbi:threonine ammonia-lyase [Miniphocaeibacter halophilus]|uniref:Threonine ammonia-lyase n=1 Tax=Miniphocaeibacter halophilus TaxID=2931922 RepID=A0AC61MW45_9FIRM|nr:threonine ammonia-lyase [Miniphocaeibacter halophilus]QQK08460.1 threonine ammonia-lyase [Miniphocaeibacter halophilus]